METKEQISQLADQVKQMNEQNKTLVKEAKEAKEQLSTATQEYTAKVEQLNKELGEKGATLKEIQDSVLELKAKSNRIANMQGQLQQTSVELISKAVEANAEIIKEGKLNTPFFTEKVTNPRLWVKDAGVMTLSGHVTGASISGVPTILPEIAGRGYLETHARDIMRVFQSATGTFGFFRSKTPTGEGSFGFVTPGDPKPKVDKDLELVMVNADYLAGITDVYKGMVTDIPFLSQWLSEELTNDYLDRETFEFIGDLIAGATGTASSSQTDTVAKIIDYIAATVQRKHRPTGVLVKPQAWANILNTKPNDYSVPAGVGISPSGQVIIASVPVNVTATNALADNRVIVGDWRKAVIVQVIGEGLKMEMFNQHDAAVYKNLVTFRVEARVALALLRPEAFIHAAV
jgi:HK97 family phage major capsid protein